MAQRNVKSRVVIKRYLGDVDPGTRVYTDEFRSYNALPKAGISRLTTARESTAMVMRCT